MRNFSISRLAETVLKQRKLLGFTQQELADKAGINRSMLCRLENQDYVPSLDQLARLANTLEFDVTDVFIEYTKPVFHRVISRNITVFGASLTGLSIATLLARHHFITLVDDCSETVEKINLRNSPIEDEHIEKHFARADLNLVATQDSESACSNAEYIIIAVPTGYDSKSGVFDTSSVIAAIEASLRSNPNAIIVIRSTVPIGFTDSIKNNYATNRILCSPDFARKSRPLYDNLFPARIIIGCDENIHSEAQAFATLLKNSAIKKDVGILFSTPTEAESIRFFSDCCLAQRISFFNEVDSFAESRGLNAQRIIRGICLDPRIGESCHIPSFGWNGYCLPQNDRQLFANSTCMSPYMIYALLESNRKRQDEITNHIFETACINSIINTCDNLAEKRITIGFFRPAEDFGPESSSPCLEILKRIKASCSVIVFDPTLESNETFLGCKIVNDIRKFKKQSTLIIAERLDACLDDVISKVYTRDFSHSK